MPSNVYNETIKMFGSQPEPSFESVEQQVDVWGQQWGCDNDVGQIRVCLMHRPGPEMGLIDASKRIEEIGSYGDIDAGWYFQSKTVPDMDELGVEVIEIAYDKLQLNGGGIHCSTCPLIRDSVN